LNCLESDLVCCADQLRVSGYKGSARRSLFAPREGSGDLLGIGGFEGKTINEFFGFVPDLFIRQHFAPHAS